MKDGKIYQEKKMNKETYMSAYTIDIWNENAESKNKLSRMKKMTRIKSTRSKDLQ